VKWIALTSVHCQAANKKAASYGKLTARTLLTAQNGFTDHYSTFLSVVKRVRLRVAPGEAHQNPKINRAPLRVRGIKDKGTKGVKM
jgi:hypothetical protein